MIVLLADATPVADVVQDPIWSFYASNLRSGLFSGFLTMASFLLTMTTFIVINMKTGYYDKDRYAERYAKRKGLGSKKRYYSQLRCLAIALLVTIALAYATATLQFTLGLWPHVASAAICCAVAVLTICALGFCLYQIVMNVRSLFEQWESEKATE